MSEDITFTIGRFPFQLGSKAALQARALFMADSTHKGPWWREHSHILIGGAALVMFLQTPFASLPPENVKSIGAFLVVAAIIGSWIGKQRNKRLFERNETRNGPTAVRASPDGCRFTSSRLLYEVHWRGVKNIVDLSAGTGLHVGLVMFTIPNDAFPNDLAPQAFRDRLEAWRVAA